jgi:hypothetical protein
MSFGRRRVFARGTIKTPLQVISAIEMNRASVTASPH